MPTTLAYSPSGAVLAVGQANGVIFLLDALTLTAVAKHDAVSEFRWRICLEFGSRLTLSQRGAGCCQEAGVLVRLVPACLQRCRQRCGLPQGPHATHSVAATHATQASSPAGDAWQYIGRYKSHTRPVTDILFHADEQTGAHRLLSIGEVLPPTAVRLAYALQDRMMVEYDLVASSFDDGVKLKGARVRAEQSAVPTAMVWYPLPGKEDFILTVRRRRVNAQLSGRRPIRV